MPQWEYCKLSFDEPHINYTTYRQDGPYTIQRIYDEKLWSWCLATLGLIGWEATGTISTMPNGIAWYFKRVIDPYNDPLQL